MRLDATESRTGYFRPRSLWGGLVQDADMSPGGVPMGVVTEIHETGEVVRGAVNVIHTDADSTHPVLLKSGRSLMVAQYSEYVATLTLPEGFQFSDGEYTKLMRFGDVIELFYYSTDWFPNNIVMVKSFQGGRS